MAASVRVLCLFVAVMFSSLQFPFVVDAIFVTSNGTIELNDGLELLIELEPPEITDLVMNGEARVYFNVTVLSAGKSGSVFDEEFDVTSNRDVRTVQNDVRIYVECDEQENAVISGSRDFSLLDIISRNGNLKLNLTGAQNDPVHFTVQGLFLGFSQVKFYVYTLTNATNLNDSNTEIQREKIASSKNLDNSTDSIEGPEIRTLLPIEYNVSVIRGDRLVDNVFIAVVALLVFLSNMGMGCKVDLAVVKEILKKPIAPSVGFCCQYIIMPLASFAALTMMGLDGGIALGLFAAGCAPGGSGSNMYTYLLDGDVSLSITMTFISTLASLFMIPAWLYSLGRLITGGDTRLKIPISNIFISLFSLLIPVAIGVIIHRKKPHIARSMDKFLRPFFIVLIIVMFTFGVWVNLYIFRLMSLTLCVAGAFLPYAGFFLGGLVAVACRQPWSRVVTIAIETGLQNMGIPILLLKFSLPQPSADMSVVSPVTTSIFTPIPLFTAVMIYEIRRRCCKKHKYVLDTDRNEANAINGDALSDLQCAEADKTSPDISKFENTAKLTFNFDESSKITK